MNMKANKESKNRREGPMKLPDLYDCIRFEIRRLNKAWQLRQIVDIEDWEMIHERRQVT